MTCVGWAVYYAVGDGSKTPSTYSVRLLLWRKPPPALSGGGLLFNLSMDHSPSYEDGRRASLVPVERIKRSSVVRMAVTAAFCSWLSSPEVSAGRRASR